MAKKAKKNSEGEKKGMPLSFILALVGLVGLPLVGFLGWYVMTVVLDVSGSKQTAEGMIAKEVSKAQEAIKKDLAERASKEGFDVDKVEGCSQIQDQYRIPQGFVFSDFSLNQLLGLPKMATDKQVRERCITFAKVVKRMEKLAHHERHVFVCEGGQFSTDETGRYMMIPDPKGRGVIESVNGAKSLIKITRGADILLRQWQVFNLGDGCIVVGMSKVGVFNFSGAVKLAPQTAN